MRQLLENDSMSKLILNSLDLFKTLQSATNRTIRFYDGKPRNANTHSSVYWPCDIMSAQASSVPSKEVFFDVFSLIIAHQPPLKNDFISTDMLVHACGRLIRQWHNKNRTIYRRFLKSSHVCHRLLSKHLHVKFFVGLVQVVEETEKYEYF